MKFTKSHSTHTVNFGFTYAIDPVTISTSGASTAGETYSLMCSVTLFDPIPLPSNVPSPTFQWFFNSSASLPSGLTPMVTAVSSRNSTSETYTSTLQFSPLNQSHSGMYTCQLGAASLVNSNMFAVNGKFLLQLFCVHLWFCCLYSSTHHCHGNC